MRENETADNVTPIGEARWTYTKEDFQSDTKPYYELYELRHDPFLQQKTMNAMADYAKSVGFSKTEFRQTFDAFAKSMRGERITFGNVTEFTGQAMELETGTWEADDRCVANSENMACSHPIMPVEILTNLDTGTEKLRIEFRRGDYEQWRSIIADRSTAASRQKIIMLADMGISVTSETAPYLVRYLSEAVDRNFDKLPHTQSIGRLGYIPDVGFSPYVPGLVFDGDASYGDLFRAVSQRGDYDEWIAVAGECRKMSVAAKIILAASFASPLMNILGALPFFVHMWGGTGTGKTVALMLAASVWADPEPGRYIQTHNATQVGHERTAAFLNHLPLCLDELQLTRDARGQTNFDPYRLAQGVGKTRGNKGGGRERTPTWKNCILSTGESPMNAFCAGGGAVNRVLDIECKTGENVIINGDVVSGKLRENYGWAGKKFVEFVDDDMKNVIRERYRMFYKSLLVRDTTEKQAMAAAAILTADDIITTLFFDEENPLTEDDILPFLATKEDVDAGLRGYRALLGWIAENQAHFEGHSSETLETFEVYGRFGEGRTYIIRKKADEALRGMEFSATTTYSWMRDHGKIEVRFDKMARPKGFTVNTRIRGRQADCIALIDEQDHDQEEEIELLP